MVRSKMVRTPLVTVPSDDEISTEFRVHIVLGFTAPANRHLKHVRTPPSTVNTSKSSEILKESMHVCELPAEERERRRTRLCVRMRTILENGILHNEQQPLSVVNGFY